MSLLSNFIKILSIPLHAFTHQNDGNDEINVAGLSGELADAQTPKTHATSHKSGGSDSIKLDELASPTDVSTLNASTSAHGLLRKLNNVSTNFLNGQGNWATPSSTPPASSVGTGQLKTTFGDVFLNFGSVNALLPGGEYGFYPRVRSHVGGNTVTCEVMSSYSLPTSYVTIMSSSANAGAIWFRQRYVTASGTDMWLFLLRQKYTGQIQGGWCAPDHPSVNNAKTTDELPHPFMDYDPDIHEIFVVSKAKVQELQGMIVGDQGVLELAVPLEVGEEVPYVPLHTGRYINGQPEMLETLPSYIKCRTLIGPSSSSSSSSE